MKTIIILVIMLISSTLKAQNSDKNLEIDIRGRECKGGVGLCTIETNTIQNSNSEKFYLFKISETELQLTIKIEALTIEDQKFLFGKEMTNISELEKFFFNQDYDFELNLDTTKLLKLNLRNPTIKKGIYPIKLINNNAIVLLKLFSKI